MYFQITKLPFATLCYNLLFKFIGSGGGWGKAGKGGQGDGDRYSL